MNNTYKPYQKYNDEPLYIVKQSNHPPSIPRQLPKPISTRISEISSNEEMFKQSVIMKNLFITRKIPFHGIFEVDLSNK